MGKRIPAFDILKGLAILCVIIGHIPTFPYESVRHWIYTFHMPVFFLVSGYFFRPATDTRSYLKKTYDRLIVPFLSTAAILVLYGLAVSLKNQEWRPLLRMVSLNVFPSGVARHPDLQTLINTSIPTWFLPALFWCRLVTNQLSDKAFYPNSIFLVALVAIGVDHALFNLPFALLPGLAGLLFYETGHLCAKHGVNRWLAVLCLICWPLAFAFSRLSMVDSYYGILPLDYLGACGGSLFLWWVCSWIAKLPAALYKWLEWIGKNSLVILCVHTVEMICLLRGHFGISSAWYIELAVRLAVILAASWLCTKIPFTRKIFQIA